MDDTLRFTPGWDASSASSAGEPPTLQSLLRELDARADCPTTIGAEGTSHVQHLAAVLRAIEPARALYVQLVEDQLRALPPRVRDVLLPRVLAEHPELASEPSIRALDPESHTAPRETSDRSQRVTERADALLPAIARGLAELETARVELASALGASPTRQLPRDAEDILAWLADERATSTARAEALARAFRTLGRHVRALRRAAQLSTAALVDVTSPEAALARVRPATWWPFREAAAVRALETLHRKAENGRSPLDHIAEVAFARAYAAQVSERG